MAMAPADSAKDFMTLSDKVKALRADAPTAALQADIDTVVMRLGLEVMVERHKADGGSAGSEMSQLDSQQAADQAAIGRLVAAVQQQCNINIT